MIEHLVALAQTGWAAYSFWSTLGGLSGLVIVAGAIALTIYLPIVPSALRYALIALGLLLIFGSGIYQSALMKGVENAQELQNRQWLQAERKRADRAESQLRKDQAQAAKDRAALAVATHKLKELKDVLAKDPSARRECLSRDDAERLRGL